MTKKVFVLVALICMCTFDIFSQPAYTYKESRAQKVWVDSVFRTMDLEEKIGQLFMVAAYAREGEQQLADLERLVKKYHIGGLLFMQGSPLRQVNMINKLQAAAQVPLMVGMDMEWGAGMRISEGLSFPKQMALGALSDEEDLYRMGNSIAEHMKVLGVHVNFAPVVDVNTNPKNPVIGYRSFGEQSGLVAKKGLAYMKGLQDHGVMACAKHFPGHGDTEVDSHLGIPKVPHDKKRMDSVELVPFKALIEGGVAAVMTAHLSVPVYEPDPLPATLSGNIVTGLLRKEMGFEGLVFTDALNMKAVTKGRLPGEIESAAIAAGSDILLFSGNVPLAMKEIKKDLRKRKITRSALNRTVRKILAAKYRLGLTQTSLLSTENLSLRLWPAKDRILADRLFRKSITLVKNKDAFVPINVLDTLQFASLSMGSRSPLFTQGLDNFAAFSHFDNLTETNLDKLLAKLERFDAVIVGLFGLKLKRGKDNYGLARKDIDFIDKLSKRTKVVLAVFGSPYVLSEFEGLDHILCAYEDAAVLRKALPQVIFGALPAEGKLPVTVSPSMSVGKGLMTASLGRLGYALPEEVGMNAKELEKINQVVEQAVRDEAFPGCQVLIARNGKVVFERSYGYQTYDSLKAVGPETIYDIASISKVAGTLQAVMFLEERKMIDMDKKVSYYLPELKKSNKKNMIFKDILTHQAGLWPYLPFWKGTMKDADYMPGFYRPEADEDYSMPVALGLYAVPQIEDSVWQWVLDSRLRKKKYRKPYTYKYSDMGYYLMHRLSERMFNQPMEDFLDQNLYQPMGLGTMGYRPLCRFPIDRIAPTEQDGYFRKGLVHGWVHDQGAAMYGGAAGHAGLFSNAHDLAKLMQMHLQDGMYGGQRYYQKGTIGKFTKQQYRTNRRGMGWDKPLFGAWYGPTSSYVSKETFGHTGFTGTAVWADPTFDLIYVFLSNRIHPSATNTKLIKYNIRTRIQDIVYQSMWRYVPDQ